MRAGSRYWHPSTLLSDGRVLVSGGGSTYSDNPVFATAEIYNPATGTWALTDAMLTPRWGLTATLLPDGRVLVSGGFGGPVVANTILASAEIYSPGPPPPDDATPPQVSCAAADGAWHNRDVTMTCTASDLGSGLANVADASFNLTTNVPVGTETASAATLTREVCDIAGNCSTLDRSPGTRWTKRRRRRDRVAHRWGRLTRRMRRSAAGYACRDGGCWDNVVRGPVANGSLVDTSAMGTKTCGDGD